jgi:hypothetical protein
VRRDVGDHGDFHECEITGCQKERRRSVSGFSRLGVYGKKMSVALFVVGLRGKGFEAICCELARKAEQVTLLLELLALCRDG